MSEELDNAARRSREASPDPHSSTAETRDAPRVGRVIPKQIGHYHVKRVIASGGMGTVYEAVQENPRRTVAVKVLKRGIASRSAMRRFVYESQILARLHHPSIAHIYEAGTYDDGGEAVPFFAMEYIPNAKSITEYAEEKRLTTQERLELFARVCDAVHHGHQKGIIHRDLKPGNILVDSNAEVKIIDFGVARGTDSDMAVTTLQTDIGQLVGTLQYMSPEQCDADPHDIDVRSDVYALGIILYELISGRLPYEVSRSQFFKATRIIRHQEPIRLKTIDKTLTGDIETIALRSLAKDRQRRYQSAEALGSDIERYLRGDPIEARRDSFTYMFGTRCRAFTRRHQVTSCLVVVVTGVVLTQWIGVPLLFHWTPANKIFERFVTGVFPIPVPESTFDAVRVVALSDDTDVEDLALRERLEGVTLEDVKSWRRLHGRLMEKLAASRCRTVVFDIMFSQETPFDDGFAKGVKALKDQGTEVVVGVPTWELDDDGFPTLSRTIATSGVRWGCLVIRRTPPTVPFVAKRGRTGPQASLALAALASFRHPEAEFDILLDPRTESVDILFWTAEPAAPQARRWLPTERIPLTTWRAGSEAGAFKYAFAERFGLAEDDVLGFYVFDIPSDSVLSASTIAYEHVFSAAQEQLQEWFSEKVVLVGNVRERAGDRHELLDGRILPACYAHASAIDALLRRVFVRMPRVTEEWLLSLVGACLGCLAAVIARGRLRRCCPAAIVLTAAFVLASMIAFWRAQYLFNPLVPFIAMLLAGGLSVVVHRATPVRRTVESTGG